MGNDLFGGLGNLGGILGGLAKSVVPKDTPEGKLMNAQSELSDLQKQEDELMLEIGRQAYEQNPSAWPQDTKLRLIRQNLDAAKAAVEGVKNAQKQAEAERAAEEAKSNCRNCGFHNPGSVKFCQECGAPLSTPAKTFCTSCGAELSAGTRFCGECGAKQGE